MSVRPAKTQISLGIRLVWSKSSLCAQRVVKDPRYLHADNEDSDQTGRLPRLIWVFAGHTRTWLVLSCRGSFFISLGHFGVRNNKDRVAESLRTTDEEWQYSTTVKWAVSRENRAVTPCGSWSSSCQMLWRDCAVAHVRLSLCCPPMW